MKSNTIILTLATLTSVLLAGCSDDRYSVTDEHCKPEYWQQLPDNPEREALIEACMTR
ncbi:entry exclusion lipoprotein TrbK [Nitrosomonas halophila]|uniref:Entry exclusion lipoprotein TrbK n=1 Tax=Nitrosomonas halophila TaxID=44576 RepID=A0A1H3KI00_9PROT|nr:entry exclusion lipoprotein TrbK [Nitrosomonas halophila]SDY51214.1 entry exclusion lipoprotein TrbK [Nitrosomonas halophila]